MSGMNDSSPAPCWVPWPDQAPKENAAYLVFMGLPYQWEVAYYDGDWYPSAGDESLITHWMPLPKAPNARLHRTSGAGHNEKG